MKVSKELQNRKENIFFLLKKISDCEEVTERDKSDVTELKGQQNCGRRRATANSKECCLQ